MVFTVPVKRLTAMDVAHGPCVPLPGRKTSVVSVHQQEGPERPEQMEALYTVLTGEDRRGALIPVSERDGSRLFECSDSFVAAMADTNRLLVRLVEEDRVGGGPKGTAVATKLAELDAAWLAAGNWHSAMVGTSNRLMRIGKARIAQEKGQPLFCWYGPPVPEYVVIHGSGPYPGKR